MAAVSNSSPLVLYAAIGHTVTVHGKDRHQYGGVLTMALPLTPDAARRPPAWRRARIHVGVGQW